MRVVEAGEHFVSCLRWAPSLFKEAQAVEGANGAVTNGVKRESEAVKEQIRCLIACGSVDLNVRVFSA